MPARIENHLDSRALILIGEAGTGKHALPVYSLPKERRSGLVCPAYRKAGCGIIGKHENEAWDSDVRTLYIHGLMRSIRKKCRI